MTTQNHDRLLELADEVRSICAQYSAENLPDHEDATAVFAVMRAAQGGVLHVVGEVDAHGVWSSDGASSPSAWIATHGRIRQYRAARLVRDARAIRRHPALAAAVLDDTVTPEAVSELAGLERHRSGYFMAHLDTLIDAAQRCDAETFHSVARQWRLLADDVLAPEERDERNSLDLAQGVGGAWILKGVLDSTRGTWLANALSSAPRDAADGRSASERRADVLFTMLTGDRPLDPRVDVVVDVDTLVGRARPVETVRAELRGAGVVGRVLLDRLACTPTIGRILVRGESEVLDVGRQARLATRAQRRAVIVRDRGCVWPGCGRPAAMCEIHHCVPWQAGGASDLDNLALLCGNHHRRTHLGWKLTRGPDDDWEVVPP